jgi:DNA polymerase V
MGIIDDINGRPGDGVLGVAASGLRRAWKAQPERRTPAYTTRWQDLPLAAAD